MNPVAAFGGDQMAAVLDEVAIARCSATCSGVNRPAEMTVTGIGPNGFVLKTSAAVPGRASRCRAPSLERFRRPSATEQRAKARAGAFMLRRPAARKRNVLSRCLSGKSISGGTELRSPSIARARRTIPMRASHAPRRDSAIPRPSIFNRCESGSPSSVLAPDR